MDSLIPALLVLGALLGAGVPAALARLNIRLAMIWAASAVLLTGFWVVTASLVSRLPLGFRWEAWGVISAPDELATWFLIDRYSWAFAAGFMTLTSAGVLTALVRLPEYEWRDLAWLFLLAGFGLAGIFANAAPAVMMAWAALDLAGIVFRVTKRLPGRGFDGEVPRLLLNFLGIGLLGFALSYWGGGSMALTAIPPGSAGLILGAAGLRGAAAAYPSARTGGTEGGPVTALLWRMAPAVSAMTVLARAGLAGSGEDRPVLILSIAAVAGMTLGVRWVSSVESNRRTHLWVGGLFSLGVSAAALSAPGAVTSLAAALLLCGGLVYIPGAERPGYRWLFVLAAILASGLPYMPSWETAGPIETGFWPWGLLFSVTFAAFLAGFIARGDTADGGESPVVPGIRSIYIGGLILLVVGLVLAGWGPMLTDAVLIRSWWGGAVVVCFAFAWYRLRVPAGRRLIVLFRGPAWQAPAAWLHRFRRRGLAAAGFGLNLIARLLEGEAAMLWALVLLSLMVSLFVQMGLGI